LFYCKNFTVQFTLQGTDDGETMIQAAAIFVPALLVCAYGYWRISRQEQAADRPVPGEGRFHPAVDRELCGGCGSCIEACPEGEVLGLIRGKAALIRPENCRGHGACVQDCPLGAIRFSGDG
jgi:NAD-dependent dihydropyrimidine dehydrogenase PreA subunit